MYGAFLSFGSLGDLSAEVRKGNEEGASEYVTEIFKSVGDIELRTRIYKPEGWNASDRRPAVVFFFGGGWRKGTPSQFHEHCRHFAERGIVAFAPEYRIKEKHSSTPTDSTKDAKSMVRWVRANADRLGVDADRVAAGGGSAGGHLAAATATVGAANEEGEDLEVSAVPDALLLFNPAVNLVFPRVKEKWGDEVYSTIMEISPHHHVSKDLPPTVIFHGEADETVPFAHQEAFVAKAKELGAMDVTLVGYPKRGHGFFNFGRDGGKDYEDTLAKSDAMLVRLGWLEAE